MLEGLLSDLSGLGTLGLCLLALGLAFGETAIFMDLVVPGEVGMVVVGAAAAEANAPLPLVVLAAALGATCGDSLSYAIGRRWGRGVVGRFALTRRRVLPMVDAAEAHFDRHGGRAVFLGRFVGALRAVVPFVAGMGRLRIASFLSWNVMASILWAGLVITIGHQLGRSVASVVDRAGTVISVLAVAALAVWWWRRRHRPDEPDGAAEG